METGSFFKHRTSDKTGVTLGALVLQGLRERKAKRTDEKKPIEGDVCEDVPAYSRNEEEHQLSDRLEKYLNDKFNIHNILGLNNPSTKCRKKIDQIEELIVKQKNATGELKKESESESKFKSEFKSVNKSTTQTDTNLSNDISIGGDDPTLIHKVTVAVKKDCSDTAVTKDNGDNNTAQIKTNDDDDDENTVVIKYNHDSNIRQIKTNDEIGSSSEALSLGASRKHQFEPSNIKDSNHVAKESLKHKKQKTEASSFVEHSVYDKILQKIKTACTETKHYVRAEDGRKSLIVGSSLFLFCKGSSSVEITNTITEVINNIHKHLPTDVLCPKILKINCKQKFRSNSRRVTAAILKELCFVATNGTTELKIRCIDKQIHDMKQALVRSPERKTFSYLSLLSSSSLLYNMPNDIPKQEPMVILFLDEFHEVRAPKLIKYLFGLVNQRWSKLIVIATSNNYFSAIPHRNKLINYAKEMAEKTIVKVEEKTEDKIKEKSNNGEPDESPFAILPIEFIHF